MAADVTANDLSMSTTKLNKALEELSSGSKITSPADDPAGLAESIDLNARISRTSAANSNVNNAISFAQTQNGFLQQVGSALQRMSELSVDAQDVTKSSSDLADYQKEFSTLATYINNTSNEQFNGVSLFSASALSVTTDGDGNSFSMSGVNLQASAYTTATGSTVSSAANAATAETNINGAITQLATDEATVGANVSRLTQTSNALGVLQTNLTAANSQITDVDVASESTQYAADNILVQSGTAMLAQANSLPQIALKLIGG
jgi:flagellin